MTRKETRKFATVGHVAVIEYGNRFAVVTVNGKFFRAERNYCFETMLDCERFLKANIQKSAWKQIN